MENRSYPDWNIEGSTIPNPSQTLSSKSDQPELVALPSLGAGSLLIGFLVLFIVYMLVIGFVLWAAGEIVVGRRVTFGQAIGIAGAGTFLIGGVLFLLPSLIGLAVGFLLFLALVRHYFRTGWLGAFGVSIMSVIVGIVVVFIMGSLAIGLFSLPFISSLATIQPSPQSLLSKAKMKDCTRSPN